MSWGRLKDLPPTALSMATQSFEDAIHHAMEEEVARVVGGKN